MNESPNKLPREILLSKNYTEFYSRKICIFVEKWVFAIVKLEKKRDKIQKASKEKQQNNL